jgi:Protein of unknown function (DUF2934)
MPAPASKRSPKSRRLASRSMTAVDAGPSTLTEAATPGPAGVSSEEVARLAYSYWEARGCQGGSPEEDWFRAEESLLRGKDERKV